MKLSAVVVIYNPNFCVLKKSVAGYIDSVEKLIVWDNGPHFDENLIRVELRDWNEKIVYLTAGVNKFISYPLNRAVNWSIEHGYDFMLSMDQDSFFDEDDFERHVRRLSSYEDDLNNVIFAINPNSLYPEQEHLHAAKELITSGMIYRLNTIKLLGGFREDYEIDCVDTEVCFRVMRAGGVCLVDTNCHMRQTYGNPLKSKLGIKSDGYSPFRIYSIICNHILLWKEYPDFFDLHLKRSTVKSFIISRFIRLWLVEDNRLQKSKAIFFGIFDGIRGIRRRRYI